MIRTTINLPVQLHHELQFVARGQKATLAHLVRRILEREMAHQKERRMKGVYQSLQSVKGIDSNDRTDIATTINDLLYGPDGAWKGQDE